MPSKYLLVPEARIGALIGPKGKTKKKIENATETKITINSSNGEIEIEGKDAVKQMTAENICRAIARGFTPQKALLLAKDYYLLSIFDVKDFVGKSSKAVKTKKARVIGKAGSIRKRIESTCNCFVSVYGDTVALIGLEKDIQNAENLLKSILSGAEIENAFRAMEGKRAKSTEFEL